MAATFGMKSHKVGWSIGFREAERTPGAGIGASLKPVSRLGRGELRLD